MVAVPHRQCHSQDDYQQAQQQQQLQGRGTICNNVWWSQWSLQFTSQTQLSHIKGTFNSRGGEMAVWETSGKKAQSDNGRIPCWLHSRVNVFNISTDMSFSKKKKKIWIKNMGPSNESSEQWLPVLSALLHKRNQIPDYSSKGYLFTYLTTFYLK